MPEPFDTFFTTYRNAASRRDVAAMTSIYADDIRDFDMWADWSRAGISALRTAVEGWFGGLPDGETVAVDFADITTQTGPDLATAQAIVTFAAIDAAGKTLRSMQNRLSWVAARKPEGWRIIHQHTSSPINPEDMSVIWQR